LAAVYSQDQIDNILKASYQKKQAQVKTLAKPQATANATAQAQAQPQTTAQAQAAPSYAPQQTGLRSGADLANTYGITYDENAIRSKFDDATKSQYAALNQQYDTTANKFYNQMYATQNTAMDTIRKQNAAAVANGASRGVQAANQLSAVLGLEQTNNQTATQLAADRNLLANQEQAAYAQNAVNAFTTSNQTKQALGNLGANLYASDTQFDVGQMNYYAALNQAAQALQGTQYTADKNLQGVQYGADKNLAGVQYASDQNLAGTKYASDQNLAGTTYAADQNLAGTKFNANANLQGSMYAANQNLAGVQYNADQNRAASQYGADQNYNASVYNADQNLAGTKYNANANLEGTKYNANANLEGTKYNADSNVKSAGISADATKSAAATSAKATTNAAAIAGQYSVKAADAANKASSDYYSWLKSQPQNANGQTDYQASMDYLWNQYSKFANKGDYESAAVWFSQMTGTPYKDALKQVKNSGYVKSALSSVSKQPAAPTVSTQSISNQNAGLAPKTLTSGLPAVGVAGQNAVLPDGSQWTYMNGQWQKRW
jgi:hypothetical protein